MPTLSVHVQKIAAATKAGAAEVLHIGGPDAKVEAQSAAADTKAQEAQSLLDYIESDAHKIAVGAEQKVKAMSTGEKITVGAVIIGAVGGVAELFKMARGKRRR